MLKKRWKDERTSEITALLRSASELPAGAEKSVAEIIVDAEYRKERHGQWIFDTNFESKKFVRWICSWCNHWQSAANHGMPDKIFYMNYCPFCGAQMDKPEKKWDGEVHKI